MFGQYAANFGITHSSKGRAMTILGASNNIGIGTEAPTEKLHVNGNVRAASFIKSGGTSSQYLKADGSTSTLSNATQSTDGLMSSTDKKKVDDQLKRIYISNNNASSVYVTTDYKKRIYTNITSTTVNLYIYLPTSSTAANRQWYDGEVVELYFTNKGTYNSQVRYNTTETSSTYLTASSENLIQIGMDAIIKPGEICKIEVMYDGTNWIITNRSSATALATPISLWGKSFTGRNDIMGNIADTYHITPYSGNAFDIGSNTLPYRYILLRGFSTTSSRVCLGNFDPGDSDADRENKATAVFGIGAASFFTMYPDSSSGSNLPRIRLHWDKTENYFALHLVNDNSNPNYAQLSLTNGFSSPSHINFHGRISSGVYSSLPSDFNNYYYYCAGAIRCTSLTGSVSSDIRLKENISENVDYISKLNDLGDVVDYNYTKEAIKNHEFLDDKRHTGLIYQNTIDSDIPNLSAEDDDGHGFVNYYSPDLIATMIGAIQQLSKKVEILERQLEQKS